MEEDNVNININDESVENPFARSGLARSPTEQNQQKQQQQREQQDREKELHEQQKREQEQCEQQQRGQSKVEAAKTVADELREFVDKRHNVHKDIKDLVTRIQGSLGSAIKDWRRLMQRAEAAESELAVTKNALAAAVLQQAKTGTAPGRGTNTDEPT
ncbi:putative GATA zinc finger domain-containing protein 25 [Aedes albopictus]|uniref:Secreted protein n=1 Tax=Aedes albopictus TaxID=7160 RepID=A0ABM1XJ50_AEDAL